MVCKLQFKFYFQTTLDFIVIDGKTVTQKIYGGHENSVGRGTAPLIEAYLTGRQFKVMSAIEPPLPYQAYIHNSTSNLADLSSPNHTYPLTLLSSGNRHWHDSNS